MTTLATPLLDDETPLIGALLRRPLHDVRRHVVDALDAAGFEGISPAHLNVFQHPAPNGIRPTDLARRAGMTKQSMNHLLRELEALGYVERRQGTRDGREREVWLTTTGSAAVRVIRRAVREVEHEWELILGANRYAALRRALVALNNHSRRDV